MTYDFSRFSPQSFETLVQALAAASAGPRIQTFGAGADGAREATYRGQYRALGHDWEGYIVFQAKYHAQSESSAKNAQWLIKEIDKELAKFEDPRRALPKPDYYVLATNVRLSATAANADGKGKGGIDTVTEHLEKSARRLGFKGVHLWHADTLTTLLELHQSVRELYSFWIQPGDVLSALFRQLTGPRHEDVLPKYLMKAFRDARDIKTRDIGQAVGRTITLEDIFVDLPIDQPGSHRYFYESERPTISQSDDADPDEDEFDPSELEEGFTSLQINAAAQLLSLAADKFQPQSDALAREEEQRAGKRHAAPFRNRVLLLGGPGQGKSTVGQFVAQVARARVLSQMRLQLNPELTHIVDDVLQCAREQKISLDGPFRYPFHIELPSYADALSEATENGGNLPLVEHLRAAITKATKVDVSLDSFRTWLRQLPTIAILDGLDEVPPSSNREQVISAIQELLDEIHHTNADCVLFVTSRPQGYRRELSPQYWTYWNLEPLKPRDALNLAERAAIVLVSDEARRGEVVSALNEAASEQSTAPLLTSPLQLMLLFHLVLTHNNIPKDRWTLFQKHYDTLRDREIAKKGRAGSTIGKFKMQIDAIHFDAGYLLHLRAEKTGGARAFLARDEFVSLVAHHLREAGYDDVDELAEEITVLATDRLVFLCCRVEDQIAFDVRSLQEFMAAARLTMSPEQKIPERLREIAGRGHWAHVFKIASSRIFAASGREALRGPLVGVLDALDNGDRDSDDRLVHVGSRLALQLLEDGVTSSVPAYRKLLASRAIKLVQSSAMPPIDKLASVIDLSHRATIEPVLKEALNSSDRGIRRAALRFLALLVNRNRGTAGWPQDLLLAYFPAEASEVLSTFNAPGLLPRSTEAVDRVRGAQWQAGPGETRWWISGLMQDGLDELASVREFLVCEAAPRPTHCQLMTVDLEATDFEVTFFGMHSAPKVDIVPSDVDPIWRVAEASGSFSAGPSLQNAAEFLHRVQESGDFRRVRQLSLPWVLRALVSYVEDEERLSERLTELQDGLHGDPEHWFKAEARWASKSFDQRELLPSFGRGGIPTNLDEWGAPPPSGRFVLERNRAVSALPELLDLVERLPSSHWAVNCLLQYLCRGRTAFDERAVKWLVDLPKEMILSKSDRSWFASAIVRLLAEGYLEDALVNKLLEVLPVERFIRTKAGRVVDCLVGLLSSEPSRRKLLLPIAAYASFTNSRPTLEAILRIPPDLLDAKAGDSPELGEAVAQIKLLLQLGEQRSIIDISEIVSFSQPRLREYLNALMADPKRGLPVAREVLVRKISASAFRADRVLSHSVEARSVSFSDQQKAHEFDLPPPLDRYEVSA